MEDITNKGKTLNKEQTTEGNSAEQNIDTTHTNSSPFTPFSSKSFENYLNGSPFMD